jgi:hypothetical protein
MVDFPTPTSPVMAPMRLQIHDRNGVRVDSSDEDGDDDDEDEFEDSEPTEATATGTDVEESLTSEGETCATPESGGSNDGLPQTVADKWVAVKGGLETVHPHTLPPPPQVMTLEAVPVVPIGGVRSS